MNKVKFNEKESITDIQAGDLYINDQTGNIYIVGTSKFNDERPFYVTLNLSDGNRWDDATYSANQAVSGLRFFKRNASINVT